MLEGVTIGGRHVTTTRRVAHGAPVKCGMPRHAGAPETNRIAGALPVEPWSTLAPPPHRLRPWNGLPGVRVVISGGQTGVDRAALDWAIAAGATHGGWCPRGRRAEDGPIAPAYHLKETPSEGYEERTRCNVRDSDATLILNVGALEGGTRLTATHAARIGKPFRVVQLDDPAQSGDVAGVRAWIRAARADVLNVAGPRESKQPGIHALAADYLARLADG